MPALIVFGSSGADSKPKADSVRVVADADAVVKELSSTGEGFAGFEVPGQGTKVWVNRSLVRMVRELRGKE